MRWWSYREYEWKMKSENINSGRPDSFRTIQNWKKKILHCKSLCPRWNRTRWGLRRFSSSYTIDRSTFSNKWSSFFPFFQNVYLCVWMSTYRSAGACRSHRLWISLEPELEVLVRHLVWVLESGAEDSWSQVLWKSSACSLTAEPSF